MKTISTITEEQAENKLFKWLEKHLHTSEEEVFIATESMRICRGREAILDMAYYLEYARTEDISFLTIIQTLSNDLANFQQLNQSLKTNGYKDTYQHRQELQQESSKITEIAFIAAILADNFSKILYEGDFGRRNGYIHTMEAIALAANKIYLLQLQKPIKQEWEEWLETQAICSWDDWVILQGANLLEISSQRINAAA